MNKYKLKVNDQKIEVEVQNFSRKKATLVVNGKKLEVAVKSTQRDAPKEKRGAVMPNRAPASAVPVASAAPAAPAAPAAAGAIAAPIPGLIMNIYVKEGDKVTAGQTVVKMEAMKMENQINAPADGTVTEVKVAEGANVAQGEILVVVA